MSLKDIMIILIVFSGIVLGSNYFFVNLADEYDTSWTGVGKNITSFSRMNETYSQLGEMNPPLEESGIATGIYFVQSAWNALKLTLSIPSILNTLIADIVSVLRLPSWVSTMFVAIVLATVIFGIISIAMRYRV